MSLLRLRDAHPNCPWCARIAGENNNINNCRENQWFGIRQNYLARLETFGRESEGRSSPVTMVVVGREGAGKSTLIKNVFGATDCETGDGAYPTTNRARPYERTEREGTAREVTLRIIDSPGLGGIDNNIKRFKKELSQVTDKVADIIFYCVSMRNGGRIDDADVSIIKALTASFGKGIWKHMFLLLTSANTRDVSDDDYKLLVESYAEQFQKALKRACIFNTKVGSIFSEPRPDKGIIPAIPVGYDPQEPLPLCSNWSDHLFMEAIDRSDPKVARELLKLKTLDPQEVAEVFGSATAGVAMGTAAGAAAAGAPLQALTASSGKVPAMQALVGTPLLTSSCIASGLVVPVLGKQIFIVINFVMSLPAHHTGFRHRLDPCQTRRSTTKDANSHGERGRLCLASYLASHPGLWPWSRA